MPRHQRLVLVLGMYLGLVALVVILAATNAYTLREPVHAVYAFHVLTLALTQSTLTGVSGLFFWPDSPRWNDASATVLPMLSLAAAAWFVRTVVSPPPRPWLGWLLWGLCRRGGDPRDLVRHAGARPGVPAGQLLFSGGHSAAGRHVGSGMPGSGRSMAGGSWPGLSALFAGAIFTAMRNLGVLPMNTVTQYGAQLGAAVEIPLLMIGLYLRSRDRRDALVRRAALQTRDPVTGLANDRVTRERVDHLVERLALQPGSACVMRVRVGNLRDIFNAHGIQIMAGATLHAASCLALITREGDTTGRLKDGDFVLILERPLTEEKAMQEAARVVARGLAYSKRLPPEVTIRFHIALSLTAQTAGHGDRLLDGLGALLDEIARAPQRVIRIAPPFSAPASRAGLPAKG
jgi:GGDEF domain-containing protein